MKSTASIASGTVTWRTPIPVDDLRGSPTRAWSIRVYGVPSGSEGRPGDGSEGSSAQYDAGIHCQMRSKSWLTSLPASRRSSWTRSRTIALSSSSGSTLQGCRGSGLAWGTSPVAWSVARVPLPNTQPPAVTPWLHPGRSGMPAGCSTRRSDISPSFRWAHLWAWSGFPASGRKASPSASCCDGPS